MAESVVNLTEDGVAYIEFEKTITQSDLDNGLTVYAQATAEHGINSIDGVAYELVPPYYDATLTLTNDTPKDQYVVGDTIEWTLRITNTGDLPIRGGGGSIMCPQLVFGELVGGYSYNHSDPINPGDHFEVHVSTTVREVPPLQFGDNEITVTAYYNGDHISSIYEYRTFTVLRVAPESFDELTWAEIAELEPDEKWIGRSKTITLKREAFTGGTVGEMTGTVTCIGINHDTAATGQRTRFTFRFDWIPYDNTNGPTIAGMMNQSLPDDLRSVITPIYKDGVTVGVHSLFYLSQKELTGTANTAGGTQYRYFIDHPGASTRILTLNGRPSTYQLRDGAVLADGSVTSSISYTDPIGYAPCFCIGQSPYLSEIDGMSWSQIAALIPEERHIGMSKRITLDRSAFSGIPDSQLGYMDGTVTVIGINHDDKTAGGKAKFTFRFDWIPAKRDMNTPASNSGGFATSQMLTFLESEFWEALPQGLRSQIVEVDKPSRTYYSSAARTESYKLWLFSNYEIQGTGNWADEGPRYAYYAAGTSNDYVLNFNGEPATWWFRSIGSSYGSNAFMSWYSEVYNGYLQGYLATTTSTVVNGIAPGFCIG